MAQLKLISGRRKDDAAEHSTRNIQTNYSYRGEIVKINKASNANTAVLRAIDHMQMNHYGASLAEIIDNITGDLHAVIHHNVAGKITILFKREIEGRLP